MSAQIFDDMKGGLDSMTWDASWLTDQGLGVWSTGSKVAGKDLSTIHTSIASSEAT
jgi:hypothetical protein